MKEKEKISRCSSLQISASMYSSLIASKSPVTHPSDVIAVVLLILNRFCRLLKFVRGNLFAALLCVCLTSIRNCSFYWCFSRSILRSNVFSDFSFFLCPTFFNVCFLYARFLFFIFFLLVYVCMAVYLCESICAVKHQLLVSFSKILVVVCVLQKAMQSLVQHLLLSNHVLAYADHFSEKSQL